MLPCPFLDHLNVAQGRWQTYGAYKKNGEKTVRSTRAHICKWFSRLRIGNNQTNFLVIMTTANSLPASLIEPLHEAAAYYEKMIQTGLASFWQLSEKDFVSDHFRQPDFDEVFTRKLDEVIRHRRSILKEKTHSPISGRLLRLAISATMFDCLAEEFTQGFYDSGDCPPPEFWVGWDANSEELICFIPDKYVAIADIAVLATMSESLTWQAGSVTVTSEAIYYSAVYPNSSTSPTLLK